MLTAAALVLLGGCGDGEEDAAEEDPAPAVVDEPEPVVDEPAPIVEEPAPAVDEPEPVVDEPAPVVDEPEPVDEFDADAAAAEVATNVTLFFDNLALLGAAEGAEQERLVAEMTGVLEGGNEDSGAGMLAVAGLAPGLSVVMSDVAIVDESNATFIFSLLISGTPTQVADANGRAVNEDGTWKLAAEIWGALLGMVPDEPEFDADAAAAEVATNVTLFFDNLALLGAAEGAEQERLVAEMTGVLEGGNEDSGAGMLAVAGLAPGLSVVMSDVAIVDESNATFIFSLLISGTPTQVADANGRAVNEDGTWKLAAEIWGALLGMVPDEPEFDADAAAAEVATNVTLFFDNLALLGAAEGAEQERLVAEMTGVLEGGNEDSGAGMLAVAGLAPGLSVVMSDVAIVDESNATFIFSLLISGTPTQVADANGRAVNEDGTWKLAAEIWGALLGMVPDEPEFDADAAAAEVATNVTLFFDNLALLGAAEGDEQERLVAEMTGVLEGGNEDSGAGMLAVAGLAPGLSVVMSDVAIVDESNATFIFSLLISGTPTQVADANGRAVNEDGTWKLAAEIWGALLGMVPDEPEFDADAAAAEVATNVTLFFDNLALLGAAEGDEQERLVAEMTGVLEGGNEDSGAGMLAVAGLAPGLSVVMSDVAIVDESNATFIFSLLISGTPTQVADANGRAVNEDGTWKLAAEIWGALLGMVPDDPENN